MMKAPIIKHDTRTLLPHQRAVEYLTDVLRKASILAKRPKPYKWAADNELYIEILRRTQADKFGGWHSEETLVRYEAGEMELERDFNSYNSDVVYVNELHNEAIIALESRDVDGFTSYLNAIIELIDNRYANFKNSDSIERWLRTLYGDNIVKSNDKESEFELTVRESVQIAVKCLSIELVKLIAEHRCALHSIEWRQLEHVIATTLEGLGLDVELTPPAKDGGKDIVATCILNGRSERYFIEIKHWRSGKRVLSNSVLDFVEVNILNKTRGGLFISSSGFSESIYSCFIECERANIALGDSDKIVWLCRQFVRKMNGLWVCNPDAEALLLENRIINHNKRYNC